MSEPAIAPERTRFAVIMDRFYAGLPFLYHATLADERRALSSPERAFLGDPVTIIDQYDDHYVLQRTAGKRAIRASKKRGKAKKEPDA